MAERSASGTFEVSLTPSGPSDAAVGTLAIAKSFRGDVEGTSVGQMLAIRSAVEGSAGYVAMERVTATLDGRRGSFALQHSGTMDRGAPTLSVTVVPDSGTEELAGLAGSMTIDIRDGQHFYDLRYTLGGD
jgi:hypothetical protein